MYLIYELLHKMLNYYFRILTKDNQCIHANFAQGS